MKLSEFYRITKDKSREYLRESLSLSLLEEESDNSHYKALLHYLKGFREDAWSIIQPLQKEFDPKVEDITKSIATYSDDFQKAVHFFTSALNGKALSNKKSISNQFGADIAESMFEYMQNRGSGFIESISEIIADREEISLLEALELDDKNGLSQVLMDIANHANAIAEKFDTVTPCGSLTKKFAQTIHPDTWLKKVTSDVVEYIVKNSDQNKTDEFEEDIYYRVQDVVGEIFLTGLVWTMLATAEELKLNEHQIILEIFFVSMLSPENLDLWDKLFRRMGIGVITLRIGKVLKYIN